MNLCGSKFCTSLCAKLNDIPPDGDLRHEAMSRLFELGKLEMMTISKITGHRTLAMRQRCTHLDAADIAEKLAC